MVTSTLVKILAKEVVSKGYQLLSFDLPEHGERKEDTKYLFKVQNCVDDLKQVIEQIVSCQYDNISKNRDFLDELWKIFIIFL